MKGIILAGGLGTRLYPSTKILSKQLLPVYDKPMIYYSLSVLMLAEIKEILIITSEDHYQLYKNLFGNGNQMGLQIDYKIQYKPNGLAEAFIIGEEFIGSDSVCLVLGDNLIYGKGLSEMLINSKSKVIDCNDACIFGFEVKNPEDYGIAELDNNGVVVSLEEKPKNPKSNCAVIGIYMFPNSVVEYSKTINKSSRGELEITSINQKYLINGQLNLQIFGRGYSWFDTGSFSSILEASSLIQLIQERGGYKVSCIEEIAYNKGFISQQEFSNLIEGIVDCDYKSYLQKIISK